MRACVGLVPSVGLGPAGFPRERKSDGLCGAYVARDDARALLESSGMADWLAALAPKKARDKAKRTPFLRAEGDESTWPVVFAHVDKFFRLGFMFREWVYFLPLLDGQTIHNIAQSASVQWRSLMICMI